MKKSLLALATLTAFAGVASAQSSVTVFGRVDLAARNVKNGSVSLKTLSTNGMASSALGFRGVEDLGGGLRAAFHLEGDISADVGGGQKTAATANGSAANGQDWQRRATVSLIGGFGELRAGRDYTPDFSVRTAFDPYGTNGVASSNVFNNSSGSGATTTVRANNSIGYFLPAGLGGLYGNVMVAAGEGAVGNKMIGGRIGYAAGPVNFAAGYNKTESTPLVDYKLWIVGGSFNAGFMTLTGYYADSKVAGGAADGRGMKHYLVGALVPFGASTLKFSYNKTDGRGKTAAEQARDADQIGVGYLYSLSKRTTLYTQFARVKNKSGATLASYTASSSGAVPTPAFGFNSTGYEFGISHAF